VPNKVIFLTAGTTSFTIPSDWTAVNKIEVIGGGAGGKTGAAAASGGGGGGQYRVATNTAGLSGSIQVSIGASVGAGVGGNNTWWNGASFGAATLSAQGGLTTATATGGLGGSTGAGGSGSNGGPGGLGGATALTGGGGGGAAGPGGVGGTGGPGDNTAAGADFGGGGGSGAGTSSAGGTGGTGTTSAGAGGTNANGGGPGGASGSGAGVTPAVGTGVWTSTHLSDGTTTSVVTKSTGGGGGGGGSASGAGGSATGTDCHGGGGGGAGNGTGGSGGAGLIVITYTAPHVGAATFAAGGLLSGFPFLSSDIFLNPDADDADGTWTTESGGTTLFASIDEPYLPVDSDYIKSADEPVADICRLQLSNPSGTMAMPATVSVRAKLDAAGLANLVTRLKEGTTTIASWTDSISSTSFTTISHALLQAEFDAIGDKTNLFLELQADTALSAPTETIAWAAAVVTNGGTVSTARLLLVDDLIADLKTDGIFSKLDRLWLFAAENEGSALTDIVGLSLAAGLSSPTFTTDRGYSGASVGIDSNFNPTAGGLKYVQDSACVFAWNDATSTSGALCGLIGVGNRITPTTGASAFAYGVNSSAAATSTISSSTGFFHINRSGSTAQQAYQDGSSVSSDATSSVAVTNGDWAFLAGATGLSNLLAGGEVSCGGFGQSLNATEAGNLYTRLRTYMTAVGVP
jgi:hypothetical protein